MKTQTDLDASFFAAVHSLLEQDEARQRTDRRSEPRRLYQHMQLLAPVLGENLPSQADFKPVECYDISCRGFSFLQPQPPLYNSVVVALGEIPFTFLVAKVMGIGQLHRDGRLEYRIGCQFTRRLKS